MNRKRILESSREEPELWTNPWEIQARWSHVIQEPESSSGTSRFHETESSHVIDGKPAGPVCRCDFLSEGEFVIKGIAKAFCCLGGYYSSICLSTPLCWIETHLEPFVHKCGEIPGIFYFDKYIHFVQVFSEGCGVAKTWNQLGNKSPFRKISVFPGRKDNPDKSAFLYQKKVIG